MDVLDLINKEIVIGPGDLLDKVIKGIVIAVKPDGTTAALRFLEPFFIGEAAYAYAVIARRHRGIYLDNLLNGETILCNIIFVANDKFVADHPLDISWWRGGHGDIAQVILA